MDDSSLSESESSTTESTLVSSVLGVKGPLRFTRHRATVKAHVVLRRVEADEDSSDDGEPARIVYFSLFAQKRIEVKPGKEILLTVEEGKFKGQAIMLEGDILDSPDLSDDDDDEEEQDKTQVAEEEQPPPPSSPLPKFAVPPKMRKTWTKWVEVKSEIDETVLFPDPSVQFTAQPSSTVQSQSFSTEPKKSESVSASIQTDLPESFGREHHAGKKRPGLHSGQSPNPTRCEEIKNSMKLASLSSPSLLLVSSQASEMSDMEVDTDREDDEDMELSSDAESEAKIIGISKAEGIVDHRPRSPSPSKDISCQSVPGAATAPVTTKGESKALYDVSVCTKFMAEPVGKSTNGDVNFKQGTTLCSLKAIDSLTTRSFPSTEQNANNLTRHRASPLPSVNATASSSKVSLDQLRSKEPQDATNQSVSVMKTAKERPRNGPIVPAGTYHNSLGIKPSSLGNSTLPLVAAKSKTKKPVVIGTAWAPNKRTNSKDSAVDQAGVSTSTGNILKSSPPVTPPPKEQPPPSSSPHTSSPLGQWSFTPFDTKPPFICTPGCNPDFPRLSPSLADAESVCTPAYNPELAFDSCTAPVVPSSSFSRIPQSPTPPVDPKAAYKDITEALGRDRMRHSPGVKQDPDSVSPVTSKRTSAQVTTTSDSRPGKSSASSSSFGLLETRNTITPTSPVSQSSGTSNSVSGAADERPLGKSNDSYLRPAPARHPIPPGTVRTKVDVLVHPLPPRPVTSVNRGTKREASKALGPIEPQTRIKRKVYPWPTLGTNFTAFLKGDGPLSIKQIEVSGDGTLIALICADRTIRIWSNDNRTEMARLGHNAPVVSLAWLEGDAGIILFGGDGVIGKWIRTAQNHWTWAKVTDALDRRLVPKESISSDEECCMAYAKGLIAISVERSVKVWQWVRGAWQSQRSIVRPNVTALTFMHDGALLGGTKDGVLWISEVPNGTLRALAFLKGKILHIEINNTKTNALVTSEVASFLINLQPEQRGQVERVYSGEQRIDTGAHAKFATQGQGILFGSQQGCALIWDTKSGNLLYGLDHKVEDGVDSLIFLPDDCIGATAVWTSVAV
ncbi:hypothetical protein L218DRAFT_997230 [Marasmius fiardii PR-910]|nr:hypothetical protein L218DRAFT_997230 [Marasmius fiardii PR-910]